MYSKMNRFGAAALATLALCLFCFGPAAAASTEPAQAKMVEDMVNSAIRLIQTKGQAAFKELNAADGPWHKGATSIFVSDDKGLELVNPAQPELIGKNFWEYKDPQGKLLIQEQWDLVKARGEGWLDCTWIKPGTTRQARCRAFVKDVEAQGKRFLVGAAYYPN